MPTRLEKWIDAWSWPLSVRDVFRVLLGGIVLLIVLFLAATAVRALWLVIAWVWEQ